ncbi:unnamed protein product [Soboliphyme baturini]|uniref:EGF-like domain-containing protein n=1 Tax=Soboliphyme baturini TaxID=241478 RepID=A0A183IML8_9BILA|nr:unnamed protein product [Soboliphyme baturini]
MVFILLDVEAHVVQLEHGVRGHSLLFHYCLLILIIMATPSAQQVVIGCRVGDHEECDELCKLDNWLYGHCSHVDTDSLQCRCFPYKSTLNLEACNKQEHVRCHRQCLTNGRKAGGYCYLHANFDQDPGTPRCGCFQRTTGHY